MKPVTGFRGKLLLYATLFLAAVGIAAFVYFRLFINGSSVPYTKMCEADMLMLTTQLEIFRTENGFYPSQEEGLRALVSKPASVRYTAKWRPLLHPSNLLDPWGNEYRYQYPGTRSKRAYDLSSPGPPGKNESPIGNWILEPR
jgi:general secretion pathway protein G